MTAPPQRKSQWAPRFWEGCNFPAWASLLVRNRFAVAPRYLYILAIVTAVSLVHSVLAVFQQIFLRHRLARTRIDRPPVFILGHWRAGTTLLHELLILDLAHTYPTTYQCLEPNHFLLTEKLVTRGLRFLIPARRPMDNMTAGWDRPQEDEFALCMLGLPSPYLTVAFPNHPPAFPEYLDLRDVPPAARRKWKRTFLAYLTRLTYRTPRRLVLKSPTHTARVRTLLELFPDARFVHIVRDPFVLYPSTLNLWKTLYRVQGLQVPTYAGLEDYVLDTFVRMYDRFTEDRPLIPEGHFHELRYEDLVADPLGQLEALYRRLGLDGFAAAAPRVRAYLDANKGYETNRYDLTPEQRARITERWGKYIRAWGYPAGDQSEK